PKDVTEFFTVAVSSRQMVSGHVRFYQRDGLHKHKDWEFANAYMLHFHESFNYKDNKPMTCNIILSPGILRVNGFVYENEWNPSNPFEKQAAPAIIENENLEPVITNGYYTNLAGEKIDDYQLVSGEKVYYVLHTSNAVGKYIDLDLTNTQNDFKYQGNVFENDQLEDLKVTADTQKIKLQVIRQTN
ncbi:type VI secretion system tube protein TssD, partial [Aquimarina agarivorans]|uniref:type VI secretion system tube protein TssD n=1 Tax=Aquimarina agarivorans TaxID=980584 RepID=UPI000248E5B8